FSVANRGASKAEHWGIPGLLWIEQGMGQELGDAVSHAGEHLKSVLGSSLGEVTSSGGDDIIKQVRGQLERLLPGTGRPRGAYKGRAEQLVAGTERLQERDQRSGRYRQEVDRLDEPRRQQLRKEAERPWEALRAQQQQAEARYAEVQRHSEQQQRDLQALAQVQGNRQLVLNQLRHHEEQANDLQQRQASRLALQQQLAQLAERQAELRAAREAA